MTRGEREARGAKPLGDAGREREARAQARKAGRRSRRGRSPQEAVALSRFANAVSEDTAFDAHEPNCQG